MDGDRDLNSESAEVYRVPKEMGILRVLPCSESDSGGGGQCFAYYCVIWYGEGSGKECLYLHVHCLCMLWWMCSTLVLRSFLFDSLTAEISE